MIIHVRVRLEFSEVSVTRLASRPLDLFALCLVMHQTLVFLLLRVGNSLLAIPTPHRPWLEATGPVFLLPAKGVGRSALCLVGWPLILVNRPLFLAETFSWGGLNLLNLGFSFLRKLEPFEPLVLAS